jgi:hypothetical protein
VVAGINNVFNKQYYARIRGDGIDPAMPHLRDLVRVPYFDALYLTFGVGGVMRWGPYRLPNTKDNFAFQFMMGIGF